MCTVSFIPSATGAIITSSRDEKMLRSPALPPAPYLHKTGIITCPKDTQAGGTWIALHQNGNAAVLLNGAFEKHTSLPMYKRSRGLVLLEIIDSEQPLKCFLQLALAAVEPFTLVLWQEQLLYECRWDGNAKYYVQKNGSGPHIWSSATLYDAATRQKRENWFAQWLQQCPAPRQTCITGFHQFGGDGNMENSLVMNRSNILCTVSITSLEIGRTNAVLAYHDLLGSSRHRTQVFLSTSTIAQYV